MSTLYLGALLNFLTFELVGFHSCDIHVVG